MSVDTSNRVQGGQEITFLIEFKPSPKVLVEQTCDRSHHSKMLTSEDHRQLAERCIRLAKKCTKPTVTEQLMALAANYLELAERALRLGQPATAVRQTERSAKRVGHVPD